MRDHTRTETTTEQELYRMVKALSDAMTLADRLAISASEKEATCKIGEFPLRKTTMVNIMEGKENVDAAPY